MDNLFIDISDVGNKYYDYECYNICELGFYATVISIIFDRTNIMTMRQYLRWNEGRL